MQHCPCSPHPTVLLHPPRRWSFALWTPTAWVATTRLGRRPRRAPPTRPPWERRALSAWRRACRASPACRRPRAAKATPFTRGAHPHWLAGTRQLWAAGQGVCFLPHFGSLDECDSSRLVCCVCGQRWRGACLGAAASYAGVVWWGRAAVCAEPLSVGLLHPLLTRIPPPSAPPSPAQVVAGHVVQLPADKLHRHHGPRVHPPAGGCGKLRRVRYRMPCGRGLLLWRVRGPGNRQAQLRQVRLGVCGHGSVHQRNLRAL